MLEITLRNTPDYHANADDHTYYGTKTYQRCRQGRCRFGHTGCKPGDLCRDSCFQCGADYKPFPVKTYLERLRKHVKKDAADVRLTLVSGETLSGDALVAFLARYR